MDIKKRWRLARDRDWQEVEVNKRWRLARGGGWQEVKVGKRWRLARGGGWQEVEVEDGIEIGLLYKINNKFYY